MERLKQTEKPPTYHDLIFRESRFTSFNSYLKTQELFENRCKFMFFTKPFIIFLLPQQMVITSIIGSYELTGVTVNRCDS